MVESLINRAIDHPLCALLIGSSEPLERFILLTQAQMDDCHIVRRDVSTRRHFAQLCEHGARLICLAGQSKGASERRQRIHTVWRERPGPLERGLGLLIHSLLLITPSEPEGCAVAVRL